MAYKRQRLGWMVKGTEAEQEEARQILQSAIRSGAADAAQELGVGLRSIYRWCATLGIVVSTCAAVACERRGRGEKSGAVSRDTALGEVGHQNAMSGMPHPTACGCPR